MQKPKVKVAFKSSATAPWGLTRTRSLIHKIAKLKEKLFEMQDAIY